MTARHDQFLAAYTRHRVDDQMDYYARRADEYRAARGQAITVTQVLLVVAAVAGTLASIRVAGVRAPWAVVAAACSSVAAAVRAYSLLLGFDRYAKLYGDAQAALERARADLPDLDAGEEAHIPRFARRVEAVLSKETGQWGQLRQDGAAIAPAAGPPTDESWSLTPG